MAEQRNGTIDERLSGLTPVIEVWRVDEEHLAAYDRRTGALIDTAVLDKECETEPKWCSVEHDRSFWNAAEWVQFLMTKIPACFTNEQVAAIQYALRDLESRYRVAFGDVKFYACMKSRGPKSEARMVGAKGYADELRPHINALRELLDLPPIDDGKAPVNERRGVIDPDLSKIDSRIKVRYDGSHYEAYSVRTGELLGSLSNAEPDPECTLMWVSHAGDEFESLRGWVEWLASELPD